MRSTILTALFLFNIIVFCQALSPHSEDATLISNTGVITATADAGPDQALTCDVSSVTLGGPNTSTGPDVNYEWTDINGNFIDSSPDTEVFEAGEYILSVTNTLTSFVDMDTTIVIEDFGFPEFEIEFTTNILTCANPTVLLTSVLDDPNTVVTYEWFGPEGNMASTNANIQANVSGNYLLVITDVNNGCINERDVVVLEDIQSTTTDIDYGTFSSFPIEIDAGSYTTNMSASYSWEARDGLQVDSFPVAIISKAGEFTLLEDLGNSVCVNKFVFKVLGVSLSADAGPDQTIFCNVDVVTVGSASNPTGSEFSYEWTDQGQNVVGTQPFFDVTSAGVYTLTITNTSTGESSSDTVVVNVNQDLPDIVIDPTEDLDCQNTLVSIFASTSTSNVSFSWGSSNGNIISSPNQPNITVDQGGDYTVTVTDNTNGCTGLSTVNVESNQTEATTINVPSITSSEPFVHLFGTDYIDEENDGPHDYIWSDQNGFLDDRPEIMVEQSGIYTFVATNIHGCITTVIFTVNFAQNVVANAGPDQRLTCLSSVVFLGSPVTSTGPFLTYTWTDEFGNIISNFSEPSVSTPGQYQLSVENTNTGEIAVDVVIVIDDTEKPQLTIAPAPTITCLAPTASLFATSSNVPSGLANYMWSGPSGTGILTDPNQSSITVGASGEYAVILTNGLSGCSSEQSTSVTEDLGGQTQTVPTITSTTPTFTIDPSNFMQDVNSTYVWTAQVGLTVTNFPLAEISQAGTYTFVQTNIQTGCTTSYQYTVQFTNNTIADAGPDQELACNMVTAVLGSNNTSVGSDFTYVWTDEFGNQVGTTPFLEVTIPGIYTLTVFNTQNNTFDSDEVFVSIDDVAISISIPTPDILDCENTTVTVEGNSFGGTNLEYQWSTFDGNILSATNQVNIEVDQPGNYMLEVTDPSNGCSNIDIVLVEQNIDGGSFDIAPIQSSMYPITITADDFPAGLNLDFAWTPVPGLTVTSATTAEIAQPGQYTFVATNIETGCDYNYVYTIYDNVLADAGVSQSLTCDISSVTIGSVNSTTGPNIEYNWQNANGTQIATTLNVDVSESGLYTLQVTDVMTGETIQDQVLVDENFDEPLFVVRSPAPLTFDEPITLIDATLFSPDATDAEFSWSTFGGNIVSNPNAEDIEVDKAGIYELTVTNTSNGCISTSAIEVVQNFDSDIILLERIVVSSFPVPLDPSAIIADTAGITHQPYPLIRSSNFEFKWVERQGLQIADFPFAQVFQDGIYAFLKIDLSTGFVTRYEYDISLMSSLAMADAGPDVEINCSTSTIDFCLGGENTSEGSEFTYEWVSSNGVSVSVERILKISTMEEIAGFPYTLIVTNTITGEEAFDTIALVENTIAPTVSTASEVTWTCSDTSVLLSLDVEDPSDQIVIDWSTFDGIINSDATQENITVGGVGIYMYEVTDLANGCSTFGEVVVMPDMNGLMLSIDITDVSCSGLADGSIDIQVNGGTAPYTFDMPSLSNLAAGEYTVSVTDANDCMIIASATINEPDAINIDFIINADNLIEAIVTGGVGGYTYDWNVEADSNIIDNPVNGTEYELTITDANGCQLTETYIFVLDGVFSPSAKELSIFPNPTNGLLEVQIDSQSSQSVTQLQIFDIQGMSMNLDQKLILNSKITLDLSHLQAGTYILQAVIAGELYYQKIIVF